MPSKAALLVARKRRIAESSEDVKNFRIALIRSDMSMKEFCAETGINHNMFSQAINGHRTMNPGHKAAMLAFMEADMEEQRMEWTRRLKKK